MPRERQRNEDLANELRSLQNLVVELESSERLRMEAERALIASEERFRDLAEMLPEIVYEVNGHGVVTFVNRRGLNLTGYDAADYRTGFPAINILVPEDRHRAIVNMGKLLSGEETGRAAYTACRKDGSTFPVIGTSTPIIKDGKVVGIRGILFVVDNEERHQDESPASESGTCELPTRNVTRIRSAVTGMLPRWTNLHVKLESLAELIRQIEEGAPRERIARFVRERGLDRAIDEIPELMSDCVGCMRTVLDSLEPEQRTDDTDLV